jgi:hypothetical protein
MRQCRRKEFAMFRILAGLSFLAAICPAAVNAQTNCASRDTVVEKLQTGYGEVFAGGGLQNTKRVFEIWYSEEQGTWTILMTRADGTSCIMASGTNWRDAPPGIKIPEGTPS